MNKPKNVKGIPIKITKNRETKSTQLKKEFPQLTYADLKFEAGKKDELDKRIEIRSNKETTKVINTIKNVPPEVN